MSTPRGIGPMLQKYKNHRTWLRVGGMLMLMLLALTGTVAWSLHASRLAYEAQGRSVTQSLAQTVAYTVGSEFKLADNALISVSNALNRARTRGHAGMDVLQAIVDDQHKLVPQLRSIQLTDADGHLIGTASQGDLSVAGEAFFEKARSQPDRLQISEPRRSLDSGEYGVVLSRARMASDGHFLGVVYGVLTSQHFADLFDDVPLGYGAAISLRHSPRLQLIARYVEGEGQQLQDLGTARISNDFKAARAMSPVKGSYVAPTALDGVERFSSYQEVEGYPLVVIVGVKSSSFYAPWRENAIQLVGMAILLGALFTPLIIRLGRREASLVKAREQARQTAAELQAMLDNEMIGIAKYQGRVCTWHNKALANMFGYRAGELVGMPSRVLYTTDEDYERIASSRQVLTQGKSYRTELAMRRKDGSLLWVDLSGALLPDGQALWFAVDVSGAKQREDAALRQAEHDPLTGLLNRAALKEFLYLEVQKHRAAGRQLAVAFIDLDGFKCVNDEHGHVMGDELLKVVASMIKESTRGNDIAARIGGDEFVVVLCDTQSQDSVAHVLMRLLTALGNPIELAHDVQARIGASIGVAMFPEDADNVSDLITRADQAMYCAKRAGKGRIVFSEEEFSSMPTSPIPFSD